MKASWITTKDKGSSFYKELAARFDVTLEGDVEILIVSDDEDHSAAFCAFTSNKLFIDIMFFFVGKEFWSGGYAEYLLEELLNAAKERGLSYVRYFMPASTELMLYFRMNGFEIFTGKTFYEISLGELYYSKTFRERIYHKEPKGVKTLDSLSPEEWKLVRTFLEKNGIDVEIPFNKKLSNVKISNGEIRSLIIFDTLPRGQITISFMYCIPGHSGYLMDNFRMGSRVLEGYGPKAWDLKLLFSTETENELELIKLFVGDTGLIEEVVLVMTAIKALEKPSDI